MQDEATTVGDRLVIGLDADDLLWHNEDLFAEIEQRFRDLVAPWADAETADQALVALQRKRVGIYGYGAKAFALTMIQTACDLSNGQVGATQVSRIVEWANELLSAPTKLIDGVPDAVELLHGRHDLYIFTKGDLLRQLARIEESGLARWCVDVEVMERKDAATYERVLGRHGIRSADFVMIGNSLVSDVYPVVEIGARAIHVPYEVTWALEQSATEPEPSDRWRAAATMAEAAALIDELPWGIES